MSYSDFTLELVMQKLGLAVRKERLFEPEPHLAPSAWLQESLQKGTELALESEKSRGEFIVAPILLSCRDAVGKTVQIFSGEALDADPERGLRDECDFILAQSYPSPMVQAPLLMILEAKRNDIQEGLGQCAAQVYGARVFNERHDRKIEPLYGCVTTGDNWQFLKLQASDLLIDSKKYFINEVDKILGILTTIVQPPKPTTQSSSAA